MIAINVPDLTKDKLLAQLLVVPFTAARQIVNCEPGKVDGGSVLLECDDEQGFAVVQVIRLKHHKNLLRCYTSKTGAKTTWTRI